MKRVTTVSYTHLGGIAVTRIIPMHGGKSVASALKLRTDYAMNPVSYTHLSGTGGRKTMVHKECHDKLHCLIANFEPGSR